MSDKQDTKRDSKSHNDRYFHETDDNVERGVPYIRPRTPWKKEAERSFFNTPVNQEDEE